MEVRSKSLSNERSLMPKQFLLRSERCIASEMAGNYINITGNVSEK